MVNADLYQDYGSSSNQVGTQNYIGLTYIRREYDIHVFDLQMEKNFQSLILAVMRSRKVVAERSELKIPFSLQLKQTPEVHVLTSYI